MAIPVHVATDVDVRRLTPTLVRDLTVRIFDCYELRQLRALGVEIQAKYAKDDAHRKENRVLLDQLREAYEARRDILKRR